VIPFPLCSRFATASLGFAARAPNTVPIWSPRSCCRCRRSRNSRRRRLPPQQRQSFSCCFASYLCRLGAEGPVQSNHCEGKGWWVRLSGISLCLRRLVSRQIIAGGDAECRVRRRFRGHAHHGLCGDNDQIDKPARCLHRASSVRINWLFLGGWR
jgi:hypothetical protein